MAYLSLLFLGIIVIILGSINIKGNLSTIHWYNRRKVSEADAPKYGKMMGLGTIIIGVSMIFTAIFRMIFDLKSISSLLFIGITAGVATMLYAQFKYNKGIF